MCRVIDQIGIYKILKTRNDYIVKNTKGKYNNHGHFKKAKTCYTIIKLIQRNQVPTSHYLRGSALRISTDNKYISKVQRKIDKDNSRQHYININKGVVK